MNFIVKLIFIFTLISCEQPKEETDLEVKNSFNNSPEKLYLAYNAGTTAEDSDDTPSFRFLRNKGDESGFNGGVWFEVYKGDNCQTLVLRDQTSIYSNYIYFTATLSEPKTYTFTAKYISLFGTVSECSDPISYTFTRPTKPVPSNFNISSGYGPTLNANPKITVTGIDSLLTIKYFNNSTCNGNPLLESDDWSPIFTALLNGSHNIYAKVETSSGVDSECSDLLFTYESTNTSQLSNNLETSQLTSLAKVDIDGDGNVDSYGKSSNGAYVSFLDNSGNKLSSESLYTGVKSSSVSIGDIDKDGDIDVLVGTDYAYIYLFTNNGDRTFTKSTFATLPTTSFGELDYIKYEDIDGDSIKDVILAVNRDGKGYFFKGNADGTYQTRSDLYAGEHLSRFEMMDIDNDSDFDIVEYENFDIKFFINDGSGGYSSSHVYSPPFQSKVVKAENVNGDGFVDIILLQSDSIEVLLNNQSHVYTSAGKTTIYDSYYLGNIIVKDIDLDGKKDIILEDTIDEYYGVFINDGTGVLKTPVLYPH